MIIRESLGADLESVLSVERAAFKSADEANLVRNLFNDPSAKPLLSLLAFHAGRAVGHILFTKARLQPETPLSITILAPLAVVPDFQNKGVGSELIEHGFKILSESAVDLVFVLGYPDYYSRHGFKPAGKLGFDAPYPIPEKNADAWMVHALNRDAIKAFSGTVICADTLDKPGYWHE